MISIQSQTNEILLSRYSYFSLDSFLTFVKVIVTRINLPSERFCIDNFTFSSTSYFKTKSHGKNLKKNVNIYEKEKIHFLTLFKHSQILSMTIVLKVTSKCKIQSTSVKERVKSYTDCRKSNMFNSFSAEC